MSSKKGSSSSHGGSKADMLRKEIQRKERDIDAKITHYSSYADNASKLEGDDRHMREEIQRLLDELRTLNQQMLSQAQVSPSVAQHHRGRLLSAQQDFMRVKERVTNALNTARLLSGGSAGRKADEYSIEMRSLLREQSGLDESNREAAGVLGRAEDVEERLRRQEERLYRTQSRMGGLTQKVPMLNSLMTRINYRRRRDRWMMAACIASGFVFLYIYYFYVRG